MSVKGKKQFGVWMDTHQAVVAGRENVDTGAFIILSHVTGGATDSNSNEKTAHNQEQMLLHKFFKDITTHMQNADEVHVTGTGTAQEQFIRYLAGTPQFKNTVTKETTSTKMNATQLLAYFDKNS